MSALFWWGYQHASGTLQAKRWHPDYGPAEIADARQSDFVVEAVGPFEAPDRETALAIVEAKTRR